MREFILFIILLTLTMGAKSELLDPSKESMRVLIDWCSESQDNALECQSFYNDFFIKMGTYINDDRISKSIFESFYRDLNYLGFPYNHHYAEINKVCYNNHSGALYAENFTAMVNAGLDRVMTAVGFLRFLFIVTFKCEDV